MNINQITGLPILNESIAVGTVSTVVGFVMTDAMWALLVAQIGTIAIMIVKDHRDKSNREQDRLDRELAAKLARDEIASLAVAGGQREERIVAQVESVKTALTPKPGPPTTTTRSTTRRPRRGGRGRL